MASILGNYLRAREGAYFKLEQEASVQQHKQRLIKEGKIKPGDKDSSLHDPPSLADSEAVYEVLPEVLQAQARVDDPNAAKRKQFEIRIKGEPAPATEEELRKYRVGAMTAAIGHIPRLSLSGRNRYGIAMNAGAAAGGGGDLIMRTPSLSPEAAEVAQRSFVAGLRALTYGSLLGFGLLAVGGTLAFQYFELGSSSGQSFQQGVQKALQPLGDAVKARVEPWKARAEVWAGSGKSSSAGAIAAEDGANAATISGLQARLRDRYNPSSAVSPDK